VHAAALQRYLHEALLLLGIVEVAATVQALGTAVGNE